MKLAVAFIAYNDNSFKYLPFFLPSLARALERAQKDFSDLNFEFLVLDNSRRDFTANRDYLLDFFNQKSWLHHFWSEADNLGFARAANLMFNRSLEDDCDLFLLLNPDVCLDEFFLSEILKAQRQDDSVAVWVPRIMRWDFSGRRLSDIIDSYGLGLSRSHRFFDRGQGRKSDCYPTAGREVFGFTGAGALFNLKLVLPVAERREDGWDFFDRRLFMYKEDVDLSYRLQLAGQKIFFLPTALMYHDRSLSQINSIRKIIQAGRDTWRRHSFLNHLIILRKIKDLPFSARVRRATRIRLFFLKVYAFFFFTSELKTFKKMKSGISPIRPDFRPDFDPIKKIENFMDPLDL